MTGAISAARPDAGPGPRWDVAPSFADALREYVEQVAETLQARGVRYFYDFYTADEQIDLWGKYLAEDLPVIYGEQAAAVVVFVSAKYAARDWDPARAPGCTEQGAAGAAGVCEGVCPASTVR